MEKIKNQIEFSKRISEYVDLEFLAEKNYN